MVTIFESDHLWIYPYMATFVFAVVREAKKMEAAMIERFRPSQQQSETGKALLRAISDFIERGLSDIQSDSLRRTIQTAFETNAATFRISVSFRESRFECLCFIETAEGLCKEPLFGIQFGDVPPVSTGETVN